MNALTLSFSAITLYIATVLSRAYITPNSIVSSKQLLLGLGTLAVSVHAVLLYQNMVTPNGFNLGIFNAASLIMWVIALLLLLAVSRNPVENLVNVLFPLAALTIGIEGLFHSERIIPLDGALGVKIHVISSIFAYSLLTIAALQSIFLAVQDYQLHHKRPGWVIQKLPPLQIMEKLLFQIITIGVFLLTVGLASGFIFLEDIFAQHLVHKTVLSIVAWWVFIILLWGHWRYGWRGRIAIRWSLSGFLMLMLAYFGSKLVLELILAR